MSAETLEHTQQGALIARSYVQYTRGQISYYVHSN